MSRVSVLETRRFHALPRQEVVDGFAMHAQDAPHADRVESTVVDQAPDGFWMHAELVRDITDTHEVWLLVRRRHLRRNLPQEPADCFVQLP